MAFFRRKTSSEPAIARLATPDDHARLIRLAHTAGRRFLTSTIEELPALARSDPTAVLEAEGRLVGAVTFGWRSPPVAWLRMLLLHDHVPTPDALRQMSSPIFAVLRQEEVSLAAITLDEWSDPWLRGALRATGYQSMVEVVGYEKVRLDRPAAGSQDVTIRQASTTDLPAVLALDAACFPLPWIKGAEILGPALQTSPRFLLAEWNGSPVGYAFVTLHQDGRLVHLVRIAVTPAFQGRGIGVRLLAEVVDYSRHHNASVLSLNTQADNQPAQRLYEWFGFARNGESQTVLGLDIAR